MAKQKQLSVTEAGRIGGLARSKKLSKKRRREIARMGGKARHSAKYPTG